MSFPKIRKIQTSMFTNALPIFMAAPVYRKARSKSQGHSGGQWYTGKSGTWTNKNGHGQCVSVLCIQPEPLPHHSHKSQTNPQQYRFGSNWRSFWVARPHGVGCLTNLGDALSLLGRILFGIWALRKENFLHFAKASVHVPPNYLISQWNPCTS